MISHLSAPSNVPSPHSVSGPIDPLTMTHMSAQTDEIRYSRAETQTFIEQPQGGTAIAIDFVEDTP